MCVPVFPTNIVCTGAGGGGVTSLLDPNRQEVFGRGAGILLVRCERNQHSRYGTRISVQFCGRLILEAGSAPYVCFPRVQGLFVWHFFKHIGKCQEVDHKPNFVTPGSGSVALMDRM